MGPLNTEQKQICLSWGLVLERKSLPKDLKRDLVAESIGPYSPDLSACDFFLLGFLKDEVYRNPINLIEELKERIVAAALEIDRAICARVISSFEKRVRMLTLREGWHIEDVMI